MRCLTVLFAFMLSLSANTLEGRQIDVNDLADRSAAELKEGIENAHPASYYILAQKLFSDDAKDDAVFWFYAGQLRYRFHLASSPDLDPSGDPALFSSLSEVVGRPLNEYAFGNMDDLVKTIDHVLEWDEKTPNGFTSKETHEKEWLEIRKGLEGMRAYIIENADQIRATRDKNGLENRP